VRPQRSSVKDFVNALEEQAVDCLQAIDTRRKLDRSGYMQADYIRIKRRVLAFRSLFDRLSEKLITLLPDRRARLEQRFRELDARITGLFLDEAASFLCALTDKTSLPLGLGESLAREVPMIEEYCQRLRERGYQSYLKQTDPEFLDQVLALIAELRTRVPELEDFSGTPDLPPPERPQVSYG
jgi:hypothetical protein